MKSRITRQLLTSSLPVFPLWIRTFSLLLSFLLLAVALPAYRKIFTCALAVLLWELCLIHHKPSYKIQFSLYRPLSFQYTSINRQRLISVSHFRQSNKKLLASFPITSGTKRNSVTVNTEHSPHYENAWLVNFRFCCMSLRKMVVVLLFVSLKGKCLVSTEKINGENWIL